MNWFSIIHLCVWLPCYLGAFVHLFFSCIFLEANEKKISFRNNRLKQEKQENLSSERRTAQKEVSREKSFVYWDESFVDSLLFAPSLHLLKRKISRNFNWKSFKERLKLKIVSISGASNFVTTVDWKYLKLL